MLQQRADQQKLAAQQQGTEQKGLLQTCLDDFSSHSVDAAAALVETAGRFLYRHQESHTRMANMLEVGLLGLPAQTSLPADSSADARIAIQAAALQESACAVTSSMLSRADGCMQLQAACSTTRCSWRAADGQAAQHAHQRRAPDLAGGHGCARLQAACRITTCTGSMYAHSDPQSPQVMVKLRNARNLDARQNMLVDTAAHACKPPAALAPRKKSRPPQEAFMRHLILVELFAGDVKKACPWFALWDCMRSYGAQSCMRVSRESRWVP